MTTNKGFDSSNENNSQSNEPVDSNNYDELTGIDTYFSDEKVHIPESSKVNIIYFLSFNINLIYLSVKRQKLLKFFFSEKQYCR